MMVTFLPASENELGAVFNGDAIFFLPQPLADTDPFVCPLHQKKKSAPTKRQGTFFVSEVFSFSAYAYLSLG